MNGALVSWDSFVDEMEKISAENKEASISLLYPALRAGRAALSKGAPAARAMWAQTRAAMPNIQNLGRAAMESAGSAPKPTQGILSRWLAAQREMLAGARKHHDIMSRVTPSGPPAVRPQPGAPGSTAMTRWQPKAMTVMEPRAPSPLTRTGGGGQGLVVRQPSQPGALAQRQQPGKLSPSQQPGGALVKRQPGQPPATAGTPPGTPPGAPPRKGGAMVLRGPDKLQPRLVSGQGGGDGKKGYTLGEKVLGGLATGFTLGVPFAAGYALGSPNQQQPYAPPSYGHYYPRA